MTDSNTFHQTRRDGRSRGGRGRGNYRGRGASRGRGQGDKVTFVHDQIGSCNSKDTKQSFPTQLGKVNGTDVTVLRDTGANCVIVRADLVLESQFTDEQRLVKFVDGTERYCKTALIDVDTPYYRGQVRANVMDNPLYSLVLGNIEGVKGPVEVPDTVQAVQTRAQAREEQKPYRNLKVPDSILNILEMNF